MTAFDDMIGDLMADSDIGSAGWWLDRETGGVTPVQVVVTYPGRSELDGKAPRSMAQRLLGLPPAAAAARAGDLVAVDRACWLLGGRPDPHPSGLTHRWIATPFAEAPAFDAAGCPLLTWNGVAWVAGP